ncbi:MAG: ester cyclase [Woeseiaceae bacterium]|nr:ester cyclase [Woeseiaceae bacterium]
MNMRTRSGLWMIMCLTFMLVSGCSSENPDEFDLEAFAKSYAAAWSSQDPELLASHYAENGSLTVNDGEPAVGRDAVEETARGFMTSFPDMVVRLEKLVEQGERIEFHWRWTGTYTGPGGNGARVDLRGFEVWTFDDEGKLLQSLGHYDEAEYERQIWRYDAAN